MIQEYRFGSITIDKKTYNFDVEVRWTGEVLRWQRAESHIIDKNDVQRAIEKNPDVVIIGTGESGVAQVTEKTIKFFKENKIELIIDKTAEAVKTFNILSEPSKEKGKQKKVIGLFHLTC